MNGGLRSVLDIGLAPDTPIERTITIRTTNFISLLMCLISIMSAAASYLDVGSASLALGNVALLALYIVCPLLNSVDRHDIARFVLTGLMSVHYVMVNVALGPGMGFEYYVAVTVLVPIVIFSKTEWRKALIAGGAMAAAVVAAGVVAHSQAPLHPVDDDTAQRAYYVTMGFITMLVAGAFGFFHFSSFNARRDLALEKRKAEEILHNVLPDWIVERLQHGDMTIAESHGEATVLFADIVDFSGLSHRLSPTHLVEVLNTVFSRFDELAARHGVEKIKTIGDCYMAAAGLPTLQAAPISGMAEFALDLLDAVEELGRKLGLPLKIRVGLNTGSVISGVIGTRKLSFDLWGETVNLASNMEATGVEGRIQVAEATYMRLRHLYEFEERGEITVKGGEAVTTYFLLGPKAFREPEPVPLLA